MYLRKLEQWVNRTPKPGKNGKITKPPVNPITGYEADCTNVNEWQTFEQALAYVNNGSPAKGIGLIPGEKLTIFDFDKCITDGVIDAYVWSLVQKLDSYTEISPSGDGLHVFVKGVKRGGKKNMSGMRPMPSRTDEGPRIGSTR